MSKYERRMEAIMAAAKMTDDELLAELDRRTVTPKRAALRKAIAVGNLMAMALTISESEEGNRLAAVWDKALEKLRDAGGEL